MNLIKTELLPWYKVSDTTELPKCTGIYLVKLKDWEIVQAVFDGTQFLSFTTCKILDVIAYAPMPKG